MAGLWPLRGLGAKGPSRANRRSEDGGRPRPRPDQWISGSVVEGAPTEEPRPDASNARSQRPATRAIGVSRAFACVLTRSQKPEASQLPPGLSVCYQPGRLCSAQSGVHSLASGLMPHSPWPVWRVCATGLLGLSSWSLWSL
jgi:hypothetical protein